MKNRDDVLAEIARDTFHGIDTLDEQRSDSLDFHEVHVGALHDALRAAWEAGANAARQGCAHA